MRSRLKTKNRFGAGTAARQPEMTQRRIDESTEWFIMPERRGAYTAESPNRQNDLGDPWNLIRLKPA
jgi:hypothetical protein